MTVAGGGLMPGYTNSAGTLTITGNLDFQAGSTYQWQTDGTSNDLVLVTGALTLPATASVSVTNLTGGKLLSEMILFHAGGLAGATDLSAWTVTPSLYRAHRRNNNEVYLTLARGTVFMVR